LGLHENQDRIHQMTVGGEIANDVVG
jgi:hypothetical protein